MDTPTLPDHAGSAAAPSGNGVIYLNNASHGLPDARVRERMMIYLAREAEVGAVRAAQEVEAELADIRVRAAAFIGARPSDLAFMISTTEAWCLAASALPFTGKRILVAPHEWASNIEALRRLPRTRDMAIEVMATTGQGDLDIDALAARLDDDIAAICVPMVSSLTGRRYPVEEIGRLTRPEGCLYIVDAAQALGQMPVDVAAIGCDVLAATSRKWLRAPRGTALLYVSPGTLDRMTPFFAADTGALVPDPATGALTDIGSAARFECHSFNIPLRLALGAALSVASQMSVAAIAEKIAEHSTHIRRRGADAGLMLFSPHDAQSGINSFLLPADTATKLSDALAAKDLFVKFPAFWNEPMLDAPAGRQILRISPHVFNTADEIDAVFEVIAATL